jgi:hypothetical protein
VPPRLCRHCFDQVPDAHSYQRPHLVARAGWRPGDGPGQGGGSQAGENKSDRQTLHLNIAVYSKVRKYSSVSRLSGNVKTITLLIREDQHYTPTEQ